MLDATNLFPVPPSVPEARDYRRWAYESALLDLALRQAGLGFAAALGRESRPVRFCASPAGDPAPLLAQYPELEVKIDAQADWTPADMARIAATDRVRVVDLKGHYSGDWNRSPGRSRSAFSAAVAEAFPDVVIEDPLLGRPMAPFVRAHAARMSFDAPVHSLADLLRAARDRLVQHQAVALRHGCGACWNASSTASATGSACTAAGSSSWAPAGARSRRSRRRSTRTAPTTWHPRGYNAASPADGLPAKPAPASPSGIGLGVTPVLASSGARESAEPAICDTCPGLVGEASQQTRTKR